MYSTEIQEKSIRDVLVDLNGNFFLKKKERERERLVEKKNTDLSLPCTLNSLYSLVALLFCFVEGVCGISI